MIQYHKGGIILKKIFSLLLLITILFSLSGCFKQDSFEDVTIYTTTYPIEYITNRLYGEHSTIKSIYPDGIDVNKFSLTNKQIEDYSNANLYIFNGLSKEKDYVVPLVNYNDNIKIIDTTLSMEYTYGMEELWLSPSNLLMMAKNIDSGFNEYVENYYLKDEISNNYEQLKVDLSKLDVKLRLIADSSDNKTIVVGNKVFKFLEKYGFNVISLDEKDNISDKTINEVHDLIVNSQINYIFVKKGSELNETVQYFKNNYNIEILELHPLTNISESDRDNKEDYFTLMNKNIDILKQELYN